MYIKGSTRQVFGITRTAEGEQYRSAQSKVIICIVSFSNFTPVLREISLIGNTWRVNITGLFKTQKRVSSNIFNVYISISYLYMVILWQMNLTKLERNFFPSQWILMSVKPIKGHIITFIRFVYCFPLFFLTFFSGRWS